MADAETDMLQGFGDDERSFLEKGRQEIVYAMKIKKVMFPLFLSFLVADLSFLIFYIIYFNVINDMLWYNWVELFHFILEMALLLALFGTDNVHRNLKYLVIVAAIALYLDLFGNAYLRPTQWKDATTGSGRDIKEILFIFQTFFTIIDFLVISAALVFSYGVGLEDGVLLRYKQLATAEMQYLKTAVLFHLSTEAQEKILNDTLEDAKRLEDEAMRTQYYSSVLNNPFRDAGAPPKTLGTERGAAEPSIPASSPATTIPVAPTGKKHKFKVTTYDSTTKQHTG